MVAVMLVVAVVVVNKTNKNKKPIIQDENERRR